MTLFKTGNFKLHSGVKSWFKLDCDSLTDEDLSTLALIVVKEMGIKFSDVFGIPTGGTRFEEELLKHEEEAYTPNMLLIVDDVLTTGNSMREAMEEFRLGNRGIVGVVIFARGKCPSWVHPIFQMHHEKVCKESIVEKILEK